MNPGAVDRSTDDRYFIYDENVEPARATFLEHDALQTLLMADGLGVATITGEPAPFRRLQQR